MNSTPDTAYTAHPDDRDILRGLAEQLAAIAALPVQKEKAALWGRLNDLRSVRPMVWITEIPWHEFSADTPELVLRCRADWTRKLEVELRRTLYSWKHFPVDMIVSDYLPCHTTWRSTGFGITRQGDLLNITNGGIVSQHFEPQITRLEDVAKIKDPVVTVDRADTAARLAAMQDIFAGIMPVREEGVKLYWYSAWDQLVMFYGVQEALTDLIEQPDLVHAAVKRLVAAYMKELDQLEAEGLLMLNSTNVRTGSGAYGHCSSLPAPGQETGKVKTQQMWGCANAQIFTEVSPGMHWDFALQHDLPFLARWGLIYYGCCEALDQKMEILRRVPNLRKVSMNYRIKPERAAAAVGGDYAFSYKPNPACFAIDAWCPDKARAELRRIRECMRGGHVEFVMKDISTVAGRPDRLAEWGKIAMEEAERAG